jgi:RHS repeat-associated protein
MKRWLPFVFLLLLAAAGPVHAHAPFPRFFSAAFQRTHQVRLDGSTAAYGYDGVGSLAKVSYGGGVATNLYQYDARQRLTNVLWNAGSTLLRQYGYGVDPTGLRTSLFETRPAGDTRSFAYTYDRLHRLLSAKQDTTAHNALANSAYGYDPVGNRLSATASANDGGGTPYNYLGQTFLSGADSSYTPRDLLTNYTDTVASQTINLLYDKAGNTRTHGADVFLYDWADRLTNAVVGTKTVRLRYNADGQRVSKVVVVGGVGTTNLYLVDDRNPTGYSQVIEEKSVTTGNTTNWVASYGYGLDSIGQKRGTVTNYFLFDGHGSVRALINGASAGTQVDTYDYDAWGVQVAQTGSTINPYRYAGEEWDADLGLYYLRARYFLPKTGRFLSMDTYEGNTSDPASLHKYLYCHANPVNWVDPSGHYSTVRQYYGYAVEDAIQDFYEEDNPGPKRILKSKQVFRKDEPGRWLFPDVYDPNTELWLEVKPLSIKGVIDGEAKRRLNIVALKGGPDLFWVSPLIVQIATGESFVTVNVAGVVYWAREDQVEDVLKSLIASGVAYSAKDLLKYVSTRALSGAIQGSIRPVLARAAALGINGKSADNSRLGQHLGIAFFLAGFGAL